MGSEDESYMRSYEMAALKRKNSGFFVCHTSVVQLFFIVLHRSSVLRSSLVALIRICINFPQWKFTCVPDKAVDFRFVSFFCGLGLISSVGSVGISKP